MARSFVAGPQNHESWDRQYQAHQPRVTTDGSEGLVGIDLLPQMIDTSIHFLRLVVSVCQLVLLGKVITTEDKRIQKDRLVCRPDCDYSDWTRYVFRMRMTILFSDSAKRLFYHLNGCGVCLLSMYVFG